MRLAGIDFEAQGIDPLTTNATEVGVVVVDTTFTPWKTLGSHHAFLYDPNYPPQSPEIVELTGITDEKLKAEGVHPATALPTVVQALDGADYIVAFNKNYDERLLKTLLTRYNVPFQVPSPWLCAYTEVPYPRRYRCRQLSHLALDHGIRMDGRQLHRATDDVELMLALLQCYELPKVLAFASEPWVIAQADILPPWKDEGKGRDEATKLGFSWEKPRGGEEVVFPKLWVRRLKPSQLEELKTLASFRINVL